jgi:hypothetical protein
LTRTKGFGLGVGLASGCNFIVGWVFSSCFKQASKEMLLDGAALPLFQKK